jgi:phosphoribosylanthranilate isomerase
MEKTIIQIYEVQKSGEAEALVALGVDHIGSVLADVNKWKNATIRKTVQVVRQSGAKSGLIPLMKDPVKIFAALEYYEPDFVHLCDTLSPFPEEQQTLVRDFDALLSLQIDIKDRFPQMDIMRSLSVPRTGQAHATEIEKNVLGFVERFAPFSDYFLIDTLLGGENQPVQGFVGITGETCDWVIAGKIIAASPIPVILAGGLWGENVYESIVSLAPAGVDSCTRTNAVDKSGLPIRFKKDMKKVRQFVEEVHRADRFMEKTHFAANLRR